MTDDLSTRLLAAIAEAERSADPPREVLFAEDIGNEQVHLICDCGWFCICHESKAKEETGAHRETHRPLISHLCQAHREIIEFHMVCQADYKLAAEREVTYAGIWPDERAKLTEASAHALIRLQVSDHYLCILARAYGVEGE